MPDPVVRPAWTVNLQPYRVWIEDDARAPDAETLRWAWVRLFDEPYPDHDTALDSWDGGDAEYFLHEKGRVACENYPGESAIYQLVTPGPDAVPVIPAEVWGLRNDADGEDEGYWMPNLNDTLPAMTYLVCFSESDARATADSMNDYHGLILRPVRIK